jgi:HD-like signal output (HDOD) protein
LIDLPDLPGAAIRCVDLARLGRLGFTDAANIISDVPSLRSRLMKLANSAAFPSLMPATTLPLAIARIGTQGLVQALIEFAAREALEGRQPRIQPRIIEAMRRIWPHALGVAVMTSELCQSLGRAADVENGYFAGLLCQIGKPVVGALLLEIEQQMQRAGNRASIPETTFLATIEACHPAAGAAVARHWDLPGPVAQAIEEARRWNADEPQGLSNAVRFAEVLTSRVGLTITSYNGAELDRAFGEGRALMRIDEMTMKRLTHGFKQRIVVLAGIRG